MRKVKLGFRYRLDLQTGQMSVVGSLPLVARVWRRDMVARDERTVEREIKKMRLAELLNICTSE
jgi:hypothetical protein